MSEGVSVPKLLGSVLACEAAGVVGAISTSRGVNDWYPRIEKPSFTPPGWVFGPVWTTLYAMMGVAYSLVSQRGDDGGDLHRASRVLFWTQLALNVLWSYLFFGRRRPGWALLEIAFLWSAIVATTAAFSKLSRTAALLMVPYLLWTSFAAVLNLSIWRLNK
ncbi:TspO/MBR family protein [Rubrobacter aplysinae]|uniref:TspO/MBR family protein n=1 Tax=Rubrobacter aplysinae TaxID=909625 RepID=UPI00064B82CC|nr:TspO/MBR family protein [Rubrobacter aplysinae]